MSQENFYTTIKNMTTPWGSVPIDRFIPTLASCKLLMLASWNDQTQLERESNSTGRIYKINWERAEEYKQKNHNIIVNVMMVVCMNKDHLNSVSAINVGHWTRKIVEARWIIGLPKKCKDQTNRAVSGENNWHVDKLSLVYIVLIFHQLNWNINILCHNNAIGQYLGLYSQFYHHIIIIFV